MENKNLGNGYEIKYVMDSFNNTLAELVINGLPQCVSFTDNRKYLLYDKYSYYYDTPCIIDKIKSKHLSTLSAYIEKDKINGWRVEVKPQLPTGVDLSHLNTDSKFHKQRGGKICPDISVFNNGYYKNCVILFYSTYCF